MPFQLLNQQENWSYGNDKLLYLLKVRDMKLGEFIDKFSHNNLIRLHYKNKGGHICVLDDFDKVSMDWEVNKIIKIMKY